MAIAIKRVDAFTVQGQTFNSLEKAVDHVEGQVHEYIKAVCVEKNLGIQASLAITDHILANRRELAELLSYSVELGDD